MQIADWRGFSAFGTACIKHAFSVKVLPTLRKIRRFGASTNVPDTFSLSRKISAADTLSIRNSIRSRAAPVRPAPPRPARYGPPRPAPPGAQKHLIFQSATEEARRSLVMLESQHMVFARLHLQEINATGIVQTIQHPTRQKTHRAPFGFSLTSNLSSRAMGTDRSSRRRKIRGNAIEAGETCTEEPVRPAHGRGQLRKESIGIVKARVRARLCVAQKSNKRHEHGRSKTDITAAMSQSATELTKAVQGSVSPLLKVPLRR
ncbi:hypothetical protein DFH06DRAFT_1139855 [Mycena polygramma]|nr:hypothetical protein DFH06DRAFT_1139855 [Mycena polygramma]